MQIFKSLRQLWQSLFHDVDGAGRSAADEEPDGDDPAADPFNAPVTLEIGDVFDLHSIADADFQAVTAEYLREAHARGFVHLRIIHGKGRGVRRRIVHTILARTEFVLHFEDAPPAAGGGGATLVTLAKTESIGESS